MPTINYGGPAAPTRFGGLLKNVNMDFVGNYKPGVDARLTDILDKAAVEFEAANPGYSIQAMSGYRPGDKRQHGRRNATDVQIVDPSGQKLGNYQNANSFRTYERFAQTARAIQQRDYPELNKGFRWGGYFAGKKGKYGALDTMHFDVDSGLGMAGGSWENGLTKAQRANFPGVASVGMLEGEIEMAGLPNVPAPQMRPTDVVQADVQLSSPGLLGAPVAPHSVTTARATPAGLLPGQQEVAQNVQTAEVVSPIKGTARGYVTPTTETAAPVSTAERLSPIAQAPAAPAGLLGPADQTDRLAAREAALAAQTKTTPGLLAPEATLAEQTAQVAAPTAPTVAPRQVDPVQQEQPTIAPSFPAAPAVPKEKETSVTGLLGKAALGALTGGIPGAVMGALGGGLLGRLGNPNLGPVSPADRFSVGTGMMGINSAMGGPRGATGYSRSNPGAFVTSRGPNLGYDLTNQYGATTPYSASGAIMGNRQNTMGLLSRLSGGLLGGDRGFTKAERDSASRGMGLY